jgi:hypothetical protein
VRFTLEMSTPADLTVGEREAITRGRGRVVA